MSFAYMLCGLDVPRPSFISTELKPIELLDGLECDFSNSDFVASPGPRKQVLSGVGPRNL